MVTIIIINNYNTTVLITINNIIITITWPATVGSERRKRSMKFEWVLPACDDFFLYLHL